MGLQNYGEEPEKASKSSQKVLPATLIAFEQSFNNEIASFVDVFLHAHQLTMSDVSRKSLSYQMRMTKSTLMNGNIKGLLFEQFPNEMKESKSSRFYLHRTKEFILLFKKLDNRLMPSNINTKNARKILSQYSLDFEENLPIVFIGFTVNKTWELVKQIVAIYIKDGKKQWVSDLLNRGGSVNGQSNGLFTPTVPDRDGLLIGPKASKGVKNKAS